MMQTKLAMKIGIDKIAEVAKEFGLGRKYNIGFENEKIGIIPNKKWKKQKRSKCMFKSYY